MSSAYFKSSRVSDAISAADSHKRFRVSINKFYRFIGRRITSSIQWVFFSILYEYEEKKQQELNKLSNCWLSLADASHEF